MNVIKSAAKNLHPSYFAMVMATGIMSISCYLLGAVPVAIALFWLNVPTYAVLWLLTIARFIWFRHDFLSDLIDHNRGPGFFTAVAGTCILGNQLVVILQDYSTASILWFLGILLWLLITYTVFAGFTLKEIKPSLSEGINGAWLTAVVATQSLSVLGGLLLPYFQTYREELLFYNLSMWLFGCMLYIWMISLIFYRYTFFRLSPSDLTPPYWINMGATAISTLAGTILINSAQEPGFLQQMLPFLQAFTIFFWVTGTWWIPMLIILGVWRHVFKRFRLAYDPLYWGAVFPLGMYTVSTLRLADALSLTFLYQIPTYFIYLALLAWAATFIGFVHSIVTGLLGTISQPRA